MLYAPPSKLFLNRIGRKVKQTFKVTTEFYIDENTAGEGKLYAQDIARELKWQDKYGTVKVVEVGRKK